MVVAGVDIALAAVGAVQSQGLFGRDFPSQAGGDIAVFHAVAAGAQSFAANDTAAAVYRCDYDRIDILSIRIGLIQAAVQTEAEFVLHDGAADIKADAVGFAFFAALRQVGVQVQAAAPFAADLLSNDIDHAAGGTGAVAGGSGAAQHGDGLDLFHRHPVAVAAGIALAAPTIALGITRSNGAAVDQNQGVFRPHAADVDLAFVAALARSGVAGQVGAGHGADDVGNIIDCRTAFQIFGVDFRYAERLLQLALGGNVNGLQLLILLLAGGFAVGIGKAADKRGAEQTQAEKRRCAHRFYPVG